MPADQPLAPALEAFAKLLAVGVSATDAYSKSGVGTALACSVSQAERNPEIVSRVTWLRANPSPEVERSQRKAANAITEDDILEMLLDDRDLARKTGQAAAAVRSTELFGKQKAMFIERRDVKMDVRHLIAVRLDEAIRRVDPARVLPSPIVER